ncbi:maleylpyruvate isomerase family mycothiol-dependent enzyme [Actinoplanes sp. NPDC023714]|uniref:maleylpyruvate isomerase family mycothiol-dependent enzyme n=1 Tax=Actinoplanes sp. NPDC023714 TaxID=3154322 RepID=UPI0033F6D0DD
MTTANRLMIADFLDGLDDDQWAAATLCHGWTVRHMAAHMVQPMLIGFGRFFLASLRFRGDTGRTVDHFTRRLARTPRAELIGLLRRHAADRVDPPRVGPMGPFAETCLHLRDMARPLGLDADVPLDHWRVLLDYLVSPRVAPALVPPGRLTGLTLTATDLTWTSAPGTLAAGRSTGRARGAGEEARISGDDARISGPAEALAMAVTGRTAALADLNGPGLDRLR